MATSVVLIVGPGLFLQIFLHLVQLARSSALYQISSADDMSLLVAHSF
jgi:hypothetical protein